MIIPIPPAFPDKPAGLVRQKTYRMERLHIPVIFFLKKSLRHFTGLYIIFVQPHMILFPVKHSNIKIFFFGSPGNIGQILVVGTRRFQLEGFFVFSIIDKDMYLLAMHTSHRITDVFQFCYPAAYIYQRIFRYPALIFPVPCQIIAIR